MEQTLKQTKGGSCLYVSRNEEWDAILELEAAIKAPYFPVIHPRNTVILNISPDYSSSVSMHMAHALSKDGDMLDMFSIDVPFPGELPEVYQAKFKEFLDYYHLQYDYFILTEAAVLTGKNYGWLVRMMEEQGIDRSHIITTALYESEQSVFKSDCVGKYFEGNMIEFYYERYNKHWS